MLVLSSLYSTLPALISCRAFSTSMVTEPDLGFGIRPLGPRILPSLPTTPIISGVATTTSEIEPVFGLDLLSHLFGSYIISSGSFGFLGFRSLGEYQHLLGLAGSVRENDRASYLLIGMSAVNAELDMHFNCFIEFCFGSLSHYLQ